MRERPGDDIRDKKAHPSSEFIGALFVIFLIYLVFHLLNIGCPIKFLTGISCMGCGMTRAFFALLKFDIKGAFSFHPLIFLMPVMAALYIFRGSLSKRGRKISVFTILGLFSIIYLLRLFDASDTIVVFEPEKGFVYRCMSYLFERISGFLA